MHVWMYARTSLYTESKAAAAAAYQVKAILLLRLFGYELDKLFLSFVLCFCCCCCCSLSIFSQAIAHIELTAAAAASDRDQRIQLVLLSDRFLEEEASGVKTTKKLRMSSI